MTVRDGMEARHLSAERETWVELDRLAAEHGLPRFKVFRAALAAGLNVIREHGMPAMSGPDRPLFDESDPEQAAALAKLRETYRQAKAREADA